MTAPIFRNVSSRVTITCPTVDWRAGVKYDTTVKVTVVSMEMRNQRTNRWKRIWSAHREGSLGSHLASSPRLAICRCLCINPARRPKWLAAAVREVTG